MSLGRRNNIRNRNHKSLLLNLALLLVLQLTDQPLLTLRWLHCLLNKKLHLLLLEGHLGLFFKILLQVIQLPPRLWEGRVKAK